MSSEECALFEFIQAVLDFLYSQNFHLTVHYQCTRSFFPLQFFKVEKLVQNLASYQIAEKEILIVSAWELADHLVMGVAFDLLEHLIEWSWLKTPWKGYLKVHFKAIVEYQARKTYLMVIETLLQQSVQVIGSLYSSTLYCCHVALSWI